MSFAVEDRRAASASIIDEALHEDGLADPGFPLDRERRCPPLAELAEGSSSNCELGLSPHQPVRRSHPESLYHRDASIDRDTSPSGSPSTGVTAT